PVASSHSFPTRRSSDLCFLRPILGGGQGNACVGGADQPCVSVGGAVGPGQAGIEVERAERVVREEPEGEQAAQPGGYSAGAEGRSEEHTSELQSQSNLV